MVKYWTFHSIFLWVCLVASLLWWWLIQPSGWAAPAIYIFGLILNYTFYKDNKRKAEEAEKRVQAIRDSLP